MYDKSTRIKELLAYENRDYDIFEQKAEILIRNRAFLQDYAKLIPFFSFRLRQNQIAWAWPKEEGSRGLAIYYTRETLNKIAKATLAEMKLKMIPATPKWFYKKWDIREFWCGDREMLHVFINAGPVLCAINKKEKVSFRFEYLNTKGHKTISRIAILDPIIFIVIDPWTTKKEVTCMCKSLPELKKRVFGFVEEPKKDFARILCWYDLRELNLTFKEIADIWSKKRKTEYKILLSSSGVDLDQADRYENYAVFNLPQVIRAAVSRLRKAVDHLTK